MEGFPGGATDLSQLQATIEAVEHACSSIQMHVNPGEAEKIILSLRLSPLPYQSCRFILETSQMPNARFQAAGAIGDAAIREWGVLTDENKRSLISFCLCYVMEHSGAADAYVQSKVSAVAALLIKRGWLDFAETEKMAIFSEVKQAILGIHGMNAQYTGINFLESLVSEFSPSTSTAMGLPREFHEQCLSSLELNYLKEFYCWAQAAALSVTDKIIGCDATVSEDKVCSAALRLMFQILNWNFRQSTNTLDHSNNKISASSYGIRHDAVLLKKYERSLVQPGPTWHDVLLSSGHTVWLLNLYATLRQKYSSDVIWIDSPLAVSARQLIVQLCSLTGTIFPADNGEMQIKHLIEILSAVLQWIESPDVISAAIQSGRSESEMIDGCHALLSLATLTSTMLFDNLLRAVRPFGTIHLLSTLTCEVVKAHTVIHDEEETWASEALDILLETWSVFLGRTDTDKDSVSTEGISAASNLFNVIVECHLKAAAESAFDDDSDADYFHASISKRDERLGSYALIARAAADVTVPFLIRLFSERFALINQRNNTSDPTCTLEELYWLLLITGHVLTDSGEGETMLVPEALQVGFSDILEEAQHPVVVLSWSIIHFARQSLDPEMRRTYFSPRLMEAVTWFFARWVDTYLMPLDATKGQISTPGHEHGQPHGYKLSKKILLSFAGEHNQGVLVLDTIVRISMMTLNSYPGENELLAVTCQKLFVALVRRRHICVHLVGLDSWLDLARTFANERTLFAITSRLQRSLAQTLVCAASGLKDSEASNQYVRDLIGPMTAYLVNISSRNDLKAVAQQADVIYMVCCLLERLRGAAKATQPRTQKAIFEMGCAVMAPLLTLLEIYKNQSAVVYLILKFMVDFVDGQVIFLNAKETSILVSFCLRLLEIYSSQNIGKISLSLSSSLRSEAQAEKYKDLRALLQLLTNICSKDLVDFSGSDELDSPDIAEVIYSGLHIVTPLISLDLLKYPKLSRDYFALVSHMLEVYPEKVARLNREAFAHIIGTLDFGIHHQDADVVEKCLSAVNALASYHYKERNAGKEGLGAQTTDSHGLNGNLQDSILSHFLKLLLQLLLFEDFRMDLAGSAADALLPLLLCEQDLYQRLVQELLEREPNPTMKTRLASAFHSLTSSNQLSSSLDRPNRHRFRKNLHGFLTEVSGFMRIK
uniref:Exportin-4 n=1 Tax=Elaeis guineensis var. tenera TaxID=51953 RepID=A0A6I9RZ57_ELAGV|nr:LOW QUALITY PROTEIN: exportin-4-like [Elaeis guineensis]